MAKKNIKVEGLMIRIEPIYDKDYINLSDIAKRTSEEKPAYTIQNWIRNNNTIRYLAEWERVHNQNIKVVQLHDLLEMFTNNRSAVSPQRWIDEVGAIGLVQKKGRGGGTYAHADIALNFCYWLSPEFQIYFIKEFQRLKKQEALGLGTQWSVRRELAKANYSLQTEAIKEHLLPQRVAGTRKEGLYFASEADLLNMVVFGMTSKQWKAANPKKKGNIRDHASNLDLLVLSNLEVINSQLIEWQSDPGQRLELLTKAAEKNRAILKDNKAAKRLK